MLTSGLSWCCRLSTETYLGNVLDDGHSKFDVREVVQILQPGDQVVPKDDYKQGHNDEEPGKADQGQTELGNLLTSSLLEKIEQLEKHCYRKVIYQRVTFQSLCFIYKKCFIFNYKRKSFFIHIQTPKTYIIYKTLDYCYDCHKHSMESEDHIIQLNRINPSWMLRHIFILKLRKIMYWAFCSLVFNYASPG